MNPADAAAALRMEYKAADPPYAAFTGDAGRAWLVKGEDGPVGYIEPADGSGRKTFTDLTKWQAEVETAGIVTPETAQAPSEPAQEPAEPPVPAAPAEPPPPPEDPPAEPVADDGEESVGTDGAVGLFDGDDEPGEGEDDGVPPAGATMTDREMLR